MKLGMMEDTKKDAVPSFVIQTPATGDHSENDSKKATSTKKFAIIGLTAVTVTAIIVGGFLMAFFFMAETTENITKQTQYFKNEKGNEVKEDIETDLDANTVYFTVDQGEDGIHHIIHDYNRKLVTTKVEEDGEHKCYVHTLDTSAAELNALTGGKNKTGQDSPSSFTVDPNPITNPQFMAPRAQEMCKDHPVHWAVPACMGPESSASDLEEHSREKRASYVCLTSCCYRVCARRIILRRFIYKGRWYCRFYFWGLVGHGRVC